MKILHTIASLGAKSGGTSTCTYELVKGLNEQKTSTAILTFDVNDSSDQLLGRDEFITVLQNDTVSPFAYSNNISKAIKKFENYDLFHTNGTWLHINHFTADYARKKEKPYIISPHGMFYPQALEIGGWKKKLFFNLFFKKDLELASCLHATCSKEMEHLRNLGFKNPIAVIPNLLSIPDYIKEVPLRKPQVKRIGFLGRLHPIKNIHLLIDAWAKLGEETEGAELCIIGKGDDEYETFLNQKVNRLNLTNVVFKGFLNGKEKYEYVATLHTLVLPSKSENFGMTVLEALLLKVPVIASTGTPWEDLEKHQCGWWVEPEVNILKDAIFDALSLSVSEYQEMGEKGKKLVLDNYVPEKVAFKMGSLYQWILNGGDKPDFVYER